MIKINERWSVKHDPHCWHLIQTEQRIAESGPNKGKPIEATTTTYHPTLVACLRHAMDYDARMHDRLSGVIAAWHHIESEFAKALAK